MLHALGRKTLRRDLVGMLLECHERIRSFSRLALAVTDSHAPHDEIVDACQRVERYFSEALPLHVLDEDESLSSRLRSRSSELDRALERMHEEHAGHDEPVRRLIACCAAVRSAPGDMSARNALGQAALALSSALEPHLSWEETTLFSAIPTVLSAAEQAAIVDEIRARRNSARSSPWSSS